MDKTREWTQDCGYDLPGGAYKVIDAAIKYGWRTRVTYNEPHGSVAVRFWRDDALPGYASWETKKGLRVFKGACCSNWEQVDGRTLQDLIHEDLTWRTTKDHFSVFDYLADPDCIYEAEE